MYTRSRPRGRARRAWALLAPLLGLAPCAPAEEMAFEPARDATLLEDNESYANGLGPLFAGTTANALRRSVLAFDLTAIPPGARIDAVSLRLVANMVARGAGIDPFSLHRASADWGEGTSFASGGGGDLATPQDTTWLARFHNAPPGVPSVPWLTPGGDFDLQPSATAMLAGLGPTVFGSSARLVSDVQGWVDAPSGNHGWFLLGPEDGRPQTARRFLSGESDPPADRPRLTVSFRLPTTSAAPTRQVPVPGWATLLLGVMLAAISHGRVGVAR